MNDDVDLTRLSKTISHALRHAPWLYELELDEEGWTPVEHLLQGLRRHRRAWRHLDREDLQAMMARPGKQRFEMRAGRIRALYGHSIEMKIEKESAAPPARLYHGTAPKSASLIERGGLKPMNRQYVHLSADEETAAQVGRRKSPRPVILVVDAAAAHDAGITFYEGNETIWLADEVPPRFLSRKKG
jgi:putative RNA 2'-phosphotransferase